MKEGVIQEYFLFWFGTSVLFDSFLGFKEKRIAKDSRKGCLFEFRAFWMLAFLIIMENVIGFFVYISVNLVR